MLDCIGTLIWHEVPADDRFDAGALLECDACGAIFVTGGLLDERHRDALVLRAD